MSGWVCVFGWVGGCVRERERERGDVNIVIWKEKDL